jgi:hypothetical protein
MRVGRALLMPIVAMERSASDTVSCAGRRLSSFRQSSLSA